MLKRIALAAALIASVAALSYPPRLVRADVPYVKYTGSFTTTGNMPVIPLTGQSNCSFALSSGTATLTPKGSSDGNLTFQTISSAGFGAQSSVGYYGGALIPSSGAPITTGFYVAVSGVSGTAIVVETCSGAVAARGSSNAGTIVGVTGSNNILCTPSAGPTVNCSEINTPGPQATPAIVATTGPNAGCAPTLVVSSTWPYIITSTVPAIPAVTFQNGGGNNSANTGTTPNTYAELTGAGGTTGVSCGTVGNWYVTVTAQVWVATSSTSGAYQCVALTGTATTKDSSRATGSTPCITALTGSVQGGPAFGSATAATGTGFQSTTIGHYTIANSTAYNFALWAASGGATSLAINGFINVTLEPE